MKIMISMVCFFVLTGCSTMTSLSERSDQHFPYSEMKNECVIFEQNGIKQQPVYSGARSSLSNITYPFYCFGERCIGTWFYPGILIYSFIDMPFSVIADTIMLPYTYNLQFNVCPNINWSELANKKTSLENRINSFYSDSSNIEHIWKFCSDELKRRMTKDKLFEFLCNKGHLLERKTGEFIIEFVKVKQNKAIALINDDVNRYTILPWYDHWVYERGNWYIDEPRMRK